MAKELRFKGKVVEMKASRVPRIFLARIEGGERSLTMDVHEELRVFGEGDEVEIILSTEKPEYAEGKDFCGWGYVFSKKSSDDKTKKILVSIGGLIASLEAPSKDDVFDMMEKVYLCIKPL